MRTVSKRATEIPPFIVMDVLEKAHALERKGFDVITSKLENLIFRLRNAYAKRLWSPSQQVKLITHTAWGL